MSFGTHPILTFKNGLVTGAGKISDYGDTADVAAGGDSGVGATGYPHVDNPLAPYCSLPEAYWAFLRQCAAEMGIKGYSPAFQEVTVEFNGRQVEHFLDDIGPGHPDPKNEANFRLIDTAPNSHKRLRCATDSIVKIYIPVGRIVPPEKRC